MLKGFALLEILSHLSKLPLHVDGALAAVAIQGQSLTQSPAVSMASCNESINRKLTRHPLEKGEVSGNWGAKLASSTA